MAEEISSTYSDCNGRFGILQTHSNASGSGLPHSRHPGHHNLLPDHASIQSMLKNSTEIGDIGLFSFRPSRVPPSSSVTFAGALTEHGAVQRTYPKTSSRVHRQRPVNDISGSSEHLSKNNSYLASSGDQHSSDADRFESERGLPSNAYRSCSLTKSSNVTHAPMSRQPSGYSTRSQGPSAMHNARSRSPFIYPARLRRPGYGLSSPGLSEVSRPIPWKVPDQRSHYTTGVASIRKSSTKASMWPKLNEQSEPAIKYDRLLRTLDLSHLNTSKPALSLLSAASSSHLSYARMIDDMSCTGLRCSFSPPAFYDYTEAFEEHTHVHRLGITIAQHTEVGLREDTRQPVLESDDIPRLSFVAELPSNTAELSRRNSMSGAGYLSVVSSQGNPSEEPGSSHNEGSSQKATMSSKEDLEEANAKEAIKNQIQFGKSSIEDDPQQEGVLNHFPDGLKPRSGFFVKSPVLSDSQTGSTYSAHSLMTKEIPEDITALSSIIGNLAENPRDLLKTPPSICSAGQAAIESMAETSSSLLRNADSELSTPTILAPTPKRLITSENAKEKLNKILLIDEDSSELKRMTAAPTLSVCRVSCEDVSSDRRFDAAHKARNAMLSVAGSAGLHAEDSDSSDEYELSKGFRETFCRRRRTDSGEEMSTGGFLALAPIEHHSDTGRNTHSSKSSERQVPPKIRLSHRKTSIVHSQMRGCMPLGTGLNIPISTISPSNPRRWNLEASCPWDDKTPVLDAVVPSPETEPNCSYREHFPPFTLRIHRASSSSGGTGKRVKSGESSETTSSSAVESWTDRSETLPLRRNLQPDLATHPGQSNSSHDVIECRLMQTRFVESFQSPSRTSPIGTLLPPSPGYEVRSFFSDDSSQVQLKGSIRKRLSNFKTKQAKPSSMGNHQGYDRELLGSDFDISRASGWSSRQGQNAGDGGSQRSKNCLLRWTMLNRIRLWVISHEERVREWRRKRQHENDSP